MAPESRSTERPLRVVVVGFEHMHAGDQIAVIEADAAFALVGAWDSDPDRMNAVCGELGVAASARFTDLDALVAETTPDLAVICSSTAAHRAHVEYFAVRGIHVLLEKPFASSLEDAEAMAATAEAHRILLGVNWPLAWYPVHRTTQRLIADGAIGEVVEVHYYDGNRGPLFHSHGKREIDAAVVAEAKASTWWYDAASGGGSLRDYLGYGSTLATWFRDGELPLDVTARVHRAPGDEVDEQSVVVAAYRSGLSTFQTRWGTFTDPWTYQPYPRCGFVIVGTSGTIASFDYAESVVVQDVDHPEGYEVAVDAQAYENTGGLANLVTALAEGTTLLGPISWQVSLAGQRIVEAAVRSVETGRAESLGAATPPATSATPAGTPAGTSASSMLTDARRA